MGPPPGRTPPPCGQDVIMHFFMLHVTTMLAMNGPEHERLMGFCSGAAPDVQEQSRMVTWDGVLVVQEEIVPALFLFRVLDETKDI